MTFDSTDPTLVPITPINPTNINRCVNGSISTNGVSYYSFDVSSNAIGAEFSISNIVGGDVNLYVKRGLPVPRANRYYAKSENVGAAPEFIQVADFTGALLPGRWYLAVVSVSGTPAFDVCGREIPGPVIPLPINVLSTNTVSTNTAQYYKVVISSNAYAADFQTLFANGDVDLFISTGTMQLLLTSPTNSMFASTNAGLLDEAAYLAFVESLA